MAKCYDLLLRLLLLGDTGVGKSCILCRYVNDEFFDTHISTIGIDFKLRTINLDRKVAKIQIWDTAGQERFESITHQFYRRAQEIWDKEILTSKLAGVLLVYDLCSRSSFENLTKWISYVNEFANEDTELLLVANKSDRSQWRQVSCEEGKKFADRYNMKFFETSAKNRENIDQAFQDLCKCIIDKQNLRRQMQYMDPNPNLVHRQRSRTLSLSSTPEIPGEADQEASWTCCARIV